MEPRQHAIHNVQLFSMSLMFDMITSFAAKHIEKAPNNESAWNYLLG